MCPVLIEAKRSPSEEDHTKQHKKPNYNLQMHTGKNTIIFKGMLCGLMENKSAWQ